MNRHRIVTIVLATLILTLAGCQWGGLLGSQDKEPGASWVGQPAQRLIQSWGPPARTTTDGADGQVLVYTTVSQSYTFGTVVIDRVFFVNAAGVIYSWRRSMR